MNPISAFFVRNIIPVFFLYGLAFFAMGLALALASRRTSEFRFAQAIVPLAIFGLLHGVHEWAEMFQKIASLTTDYSPGVLEEVLRLALLAASLLSLLAFGLILLSPTRLRGWRLAAPLVAMAGLWLAGSVVAAVVLRSTPEAAVAQADVLARYSLGMPAALLGAWALMAQQRTFREHDMPQFGRDLVWATLALLLYGVVGQVFVRQTALTPSTVVNSTLFLQWFGVPVQLFRGVIATVLLVFLLRALNAFELEGQRRLEAANAGKLAAQAEALAAERQISREREALNTELRRTAQELALLLELSNLLAMPITLDERLQSALQRLVHSVDYADAGMVLLARRPNLNIEPRAVIGLPDGNDASWRPAATEIGVRSATRGLVICRHVDGSTLEISPLEVLSAAHCHRIASPTTIIALPLIVEQQAIGSIVLSQPSPSDGRPLTSEGIELLLGVTRQLSLSIENARLYEEAQERERLLAALLRQVVDAQEKERQRIARELHDATGQSLTAISLGLRGVESVLEMAEPPRVAAQVAELRAFATQALGELRQIIADLRPSILDDMGLAAALQWYVQGFEQRRGIATVFEVAGTPMRLPSEYETVLFRITQEALSNIAKHAAATRVAVRLAFAATHVTLTMEDNGQGFDPSHFLRRNGQQTGWGLLGMQERAALLGGRCQIDSQPGAGTRIEVYVPLKPGAVEASHGEN